MRFSQRLKGTLSPSTPLPAMHSSPTSVSFNCCPSLLNSVRLQFSAWVPLPRWKPRSSLQVGSGDRGLFVVSFSLGSEFCAAYCPILGHILSSSYLYLFVAGGHVPHQLSLNGCKSTLLHKFLVLFLISRFFYPS